MNQNKQKKVAFLGAGHIATIIAEALHPYLAGSKEGQIFLTRKHSPFSEDLQGKFVCGYDNAAAVNGADIIFLGPKPGQLAELLSEIKPAFASSTIIISMAGRIRIDEIEQQIGWCDAYRIMPSILASIGKGVILMTAVPGHTDQEACLKRMFSEISEHVFTVEESLLHMGTIFVGSMPAIVAYFFSEVPLSETMALDAHVRNVITDMACERGFDRLLAKPIISAAESGVRELLLSGHTCEEIIAEVATKGGCTQATLDAYNALGGVAGIFSEPEKVEWKIRCGIGEGINKLLSL